MLLWLLLQTRWLRYLLVKTLRKRELVREGRVHLILDIAHLNLLLRLELLEVVGKILRLLHLL